MVILKPPKLEDHTLLDVEALQKFIYVLCYSD
jgi:hypothetical protein